MRLCDIWTESEFQFTPLREGRPMTQATLYIGLNISIHAPPRGATPTPTPTPPASYFNSRPSARGDGCAAGEARLLHLFQFTPLREGRLDGIRHLVQLILISIHAPPRGATRLAKRAGQGKGISIHAPPRGATVHGVCWGYWNLISIHAPPRGATVSASVEKS